MRPAAEKFGAPGAGITSGDVAPCLTPPIEARSLAARTLTTDSDLDAAVVDHGDLVDEAVGRRSTRPLDADRRVGDRIAGAAQGTDEAGAAAVEQLVADRRRLDTVDGDGELGQVADVGVEQAVRPVGAELAVGTRQHARRGADAGDQLVEERLPHGLQSSRAEVYRSNAVARGFERSTRGPTPATT